MQSIAANLIFYSYGLGLIGRVDTKSTIAMALAVYAFQLVFSVVWLRYFQFGPMEWLWRSLTYSRRQPLLLAHLVTEK